MVRPLHDADGELTLLGAVLKFSALLVAIASALALIPVGFVGMMSPMMCAGGCTTAVHWLAILMMVSPLLLLISAMAGVVAFSAPSWSLILLTFIPAVIVMAVFMMGDLL